MERRLINALSCGSLADITPNEIRALKRSFQSNQNTLQIKKNGIQISREE